jgi:dTDP-4-dehydrorhamnose reductase
MKRSLIIGASGLVGGHLSMVLASSSRDCVATFHKNPIPGGVRLDIRNRLEVENFFTEFKPAVVYLPGASPNVDDCEIHPEETYLTNVNGVKNVVDAANQAGTRLVYFSSDYIFDGRSGPYREADPAHPISVYGQQKLAAEHYVSLHSKNYLIVRTTVVYGWEWQGKNFIYRLIKSLREGAEARAPRDQVGSPTYVNNLAQITIELASSMIQGVVNVAGPDLVNRYEFALAAARIFELDEKLIRPVETKTLDQPAKRPLLAGLVTEKIKSLTQIPLCRISEGLTLMKSDNIIPHGLP